MSIFDKAYGDHKAEVDARKEKLAESIKASEEKKSTSHEVFWQAVEKIVKPIFDAVSADAEKENFRSRVEMVDNLQLGNSFITLYFLPEKGMARASSASDEAAYSVKLVLESGMVQHNVYFDQRPNMNGVDRFETTIAGITTDYVAGLADSLIRKSLKSR